MKLLDDVQDAFLESINISRKDALLNFNLGPTCLRRDIAMLGVLHKVVLRVAPDPLQEMFSKKACDLRHFGFQEGPKLHDKQLQDNVGNYSPILLKRSLFGLVHVYNRLPQVVVDAVSVQSLQRKLQCIAKVEVETNPKWDLVFHRKC